MLETTLASSFRPGSNLKGHSAGANWTFLLPSLEARAIVCLGVPLASTLRTLARLGAGHPARTLTILCTRPAELATASDRLRQAGVADAHVCPLGARLPADDGSVDLIVVAAAAVARRLRRSAELQRDVVRILAPAGTLYLESGWRPMGAPEPALNGRLGLPLARRPLWLTPLIGEMRTAVPLDDEHTIDYFRRHRLEEHSFDRRLWRRLSRAVTPTSRWLPPTRRQGLLVEKPAAPARRVGPPAYLLASAARRGLDWRGYRWGVVAPGGYDSRKVVFFLFPPEAPAPSHIVKITRNPAHNARLENEHAALAALEGTAFAAAGAMPLAVFLDHHAGLALVGETAVEGVAFRDRTTGAPDCPLAGAAIARLTDLAATTRRDPATPGGAADALAALLARFVEIYGPEPAVRRALDAQVDRLATAPSPLPQVFQHGDPGVWNVLAQGHDTVTFLDWEAAEPVGVPLWDLFYFYRSFCMITAPTRGRDARLAHLGRVMLGESPLSARLLEATERYCAGVGVPPSAVEPLFYTCWMHRALKEATRQTRRRLPEAHYYRLLLVALAARRGRFLSRLFSR